MMRRCAIYARYSSDLQRDTSIQDQVRNCERHAEKNGWSVVPKATFSDAGISGTSMQTRAGLQALLAEVKSPKRRFTCVLIDDTSRISRNMADTMKLQDILKFHGVHLVSVMDGLDSAQESSRFGLIMSGMKNEDFVKSLGDKVRRGQEGQVLRGLVPGGRCFGYDNVPIEDPTRKGQYGRPYVVGVERKVNPEQAEVVRKIFTLYANGLSLLKVARYLNDAGVPTFRPTTTLRSGERTLWHQSSVRYVLTNELYHGVCVYNRRKNAKNPITGKEAAQWQSKERWNRVANPAWKIVPDKLWNAVHERLAIQQKFHKGGGGMGKSNLVFSGLIYCGDCGRRMTILRKYELYSKFGCPAAFKQGQCKNKSLIRDTRLTDQLLNMIEDTVLQHDSVEYIIEQFRSSVQKRFRELKAASAKAGSSKKELLKEQKEVQKQIDKLTDAIAMSGGSKALLDRLNATEVKLTEITERLDTIQMPEMQLDTKEMERFINRIASQIRRVIHGDKTAPALRQMMLRHVERITLFREKHEGKEVFRADGLFKFGTEVSAQTRINTGVNTVHNDSLLNTVFTLPMRGTLIVGEDFKRCEKTGRITHIA
jgi:site-specific DNA recombinase